MSLDGEPRKGREMSGETARELASSADIVMKGWTDMSDAPSTCHKYIHVDI